MQHRVTGYAEVFVEFDWVIESVSLCFHFPLRFECFKCVLDVNIESLDVVQVSNEVKFPMLETVLGLTEFEKFCFLLSKIDSIT